MPAREPSRFKSAAAHIPGSLKITRGGQLIALEKVGTGKWTLSGNNAYTGGTKVSGGTLEIANAGSLGVGTVTLNGGTLQLSSGMDRGIGIVMAADSTIDLNAGADFWFRKSLTGNADLTISSVNDKRGVFHIGSDSSSYTGTVTMAATGAQSTYFVLESGAKDFSAGALVLNNNTNFFYNAAAGDVFQVGMLSGTSGSSVQAYTSSAGETTTLQVGNDVDYTEHTFGGVLKNRSVTQILAVEKVGSNTWTLSGANTYTGATTVSEGVLEVTGSLVSPVTVKQDATLLVDGGTLTGGLTLEEGAVLMGNYSGAATFANGAILNFDLDDLQNMDLMDATFGGDIVVALEALDAEALRDQTFDLFTTDEADILDMISLNTANAPGLVYWITSYANGTVSVLAGDPSKVPEPGTWILLLGMLGMYFRRIKREAIRE